MALSLPMLRALRTSRVRSLWCVALLLSGTGLWVACDSASRTASGDDAAEMGGYYEVEGTTTVVATGDERGISGSVIVAQDGDAYTATFHLSTSFATADGNLRAEVIGSGQGVVQEAQLVGTSETQILTAAFPGVDTKFPFLAQRYGPKVLSKSVATLKPDGTMMIEIESVAAEGEEYAATRTSLTGGRAKPRGVPGFPLPEVAASDE